MPDLSSQEAHLPAVQRILLLLFLWTQAHPLLRREGLHFQETEEGPLLLRTKFLYFPQLQDPASPNIQDSPFWSQESLFLRIQVLSCSMILELSFPRIQDLPF